jgi:hypothetical protein
MGSTLPSMPSMVSASQAGVEAAAGHDDLHVLAQVGAGARQVEALDLDLRIDRQRRGDRPTLAADGGVLPEPGIELERHLPEAGPGHVLGQEVGSGDREGGQLLPRSVGECDVDALPLDPGDAELKRGLRPGR